MYKLQNSDDYFDQMLENSPSNVKSDKYLSFIESYEKIFALGLEKYGYLNKNAIKYFFMKYEQLKKQCLHPELFYRRLIEVFEKYKLKKRPKLINSLALKGGEILQFFQQGQEISLVVQGEIVPQVTQWNLENIRKIFPKAEIILSTYRLQDVEPGTYDKLIINPDPGSFFYNSKSNSNSNNINRQLVSTLAGLKLASRKYVFKIRSDFILTDCTFLDYFDKFLVTNSDYKIFKHKVLACTYFTRNPKFKKSTYAFHPSDMAFFGLKEDLINLFEIPLMPKTEEFYCEYKGNLYNRYVPEQYLWVNCLRKNGKDIQLEHQCQNNSKLIEETEKYFVSNFIFLNWEQFNLVPSDKFLNYHKYDYVSCITHLEWQKLYQQYLDSSWLVPTKDAERTRIQRQHWQKKFYRFIANCLVLPLIGKSRSNLRHKAREWVIELLSKGRPKL
ncbi:MAG: WavE lipopolysaccharide synthesis family protein [Deltaproteobacteria bacterium]|jgi:hypothetical protein|nr:WavE lipopolysaccharide synthesis family protein [Deltaproteobacteria bacterium]